MIKEWILNFLGHYDCFNRIKYRDEEIKILEDSLIKEKRKRGSKK